MGGDCAEGGGELKEEREEGEVYGRSGRHWDEECADGDAVMVSWREGFGMKLQIVDLDECGRG